MTLKHKRPSVPPEPVTSKPDNWSGSWGRINPTPTGLEVVRFCQRPDGSSERTHSYPYRVLSSWHWIENSLEEELKIEAGADLVTVRGRGLIRIVDALDTGTLEVLSEVPGEIAAYEESPIWVTAISVESRREE